MPPWLPLFLVGVVLALVTHEAGHATIALLVGIRPRLINIGLGPCLCAVRWSRIAVVVRLLPIAGYVSIVSPGAGYRLGRALFILGGIIGNVAAFALLAVISAVRPNISPSCGTLAAAQFYVAFLAFLPMPAKVDGVRYGTDGLQLLRLLFKDAADRIPAVFQNLVRTIDPDVEETVAMSGVAREIIYHIARLDKAKEPWDSRFSIDSMRDLLRGGQLSRHESLLALEYMVSHELTNRSGNISADELDSWSKELITLSGSLPSRVTRGGALVMIGHVEEARRLLVPLLDQHMTCGNLIGCHAFLAQASAALGERDAMVRHSEDARRMAIETGQQSQIEVVEKLLKHI